MQSCQNVEEGKNRELNESHVITETYTRGSPSTSGRDAARGRRQAVCDDMILATEQQQLNESSAALSEPLLGVHSGGSSTRNYGELRQPTDHDLRDIEALLSQARQLRD